MSFECLGTGRERRRNVPKIQEREGNAKILPPRTENAKEMEIPFPHFVYGNQRLSFPSDTHPTFCSKAKVFTVWRQIEIVWSTLGVRMFDS